MNDKTRVLVTGAAGQIGGIIRDKLGYRYDLVGLDRVDCGWADSHVADISDFDAIRPAFDGRASGGGSQPDGVLGIHPEQQHHRDRNVYPGRRARGGLFLPARITYWVLSAEDDPYKAIYDGRLSRRLQDA